MVSLKIVSSVSERMLATASPAGCGSGIGGEPSRLISTGLVDPSQSVWDCDGLFGRCSDDVRASSVSARCAPVTPGSIGSASDLSSPNNRIWSESYGLREGPACAGLVVLFNTERRADPVSWLGSASTGKRNFGMSSRSAVCREDAFCGVSLLLEWSRTGLDREEEGCTSAGEQTSVFIDMRRGFFSVIEGVSKTRALFKYSFAVDDT